MLPGDVTMSQAYANIAKKVSNIGDQASKFANEQLGLKGYEANFGTSTGGSLNKYDSSGLTYPEDLFSTGISQYGDNYVVFYINVANDSKIISKNEVETVDVADSERLRGNLAQSGIDAIQAGIASTGIGLGAGGLSTIAGLGVKTVLTTTAGAAASTGLVAASSKGVISRQQKRLKSVIALNMPNALSIRYSSSYADEGTMAFQALAQMTAGGAEALERYNENGSVDVSNLTSAAQSALTAAALNTPGIGDALSVASGLAANPKKELLFKGVDFRTFSFDYQFAPRSETELRNVMNIINTFKYHMHPEFKDKSSFIFVYPSEFDIQYFHKQGENQYIHKHTSCVLKELSVNYTPHGSFNSFENGAPTIIDVQLTFQELAILTKDQIEMGY